MQFEVKLDGLKYVYADIWEIYIENLTIRFSSMGVYIQLFWVMDMMYRDVERHQKVLNGLKKKFNPELVEVKNQ